MVTRDFDAMLAQRAGVRPTFRVAGQEFTARARMPFKRFNLLVDILTEPDTGTDNERAERFFRIALIPADRERFAALLNTEDDDADDESVIDNQQVGEITNWLLELYSGKLLTNSDSLSDGGQTTSPRPTVVSLNPRTQAG